MFKVSSISREEDDTPCSLSSADWSSRQVSGCRKRPTVRADARDGATTPARTRLRTARSPRLAAAPFRSRGSSGRFRSALTSRSCRTARRTEREPTPDYRVITNGVEIGGMAAHQSRPGRFLCLAELGGTGIRRAGSTPISGVRPDRMTTTSLRSSGTPPTKPPGRAGSTVQPAPRSFRSHFHCCVRDAVYITLLLARQASSID